MTTTHPYYAPVNPHLAALPTPNFITLDGIRDRVQPRGLSTGCIVTGPARSGSRYAARALSIHTGAVYGHESCLSLSRVNDCRPGEKPGLFDAMARQLACEVSWLAAPFAAAGHINDTILLVHLTRHPLRAIESIARRGFLWYSRPPAPSPNPYGFYARRWMERFPLPTPHESPNYYNTQASLIGSAAIYWLTWTNMLLQHTPAPVIRIEDLTQEFRSVHGPIISMTENGGGVGDQQRADIRELEDLPLYLRGDVKEVGEKLGYEF